MSSAVRSVGVAGLVAAWLLVGAAGAPAEAWKVTVQGNGTDLGETPLIVPLKEAVAPGAYRLALAPSADGGPTIPAQVFADGDQLYLAIVLPRLAGDVAITYSMTSDPKPEPTVELVPSEKRVEVRLAGLPFTTYRLDAGPKPCYYPLIGPTGARMTRSFPIEQVAGEKRDHPHQRSLWFTHGKVNGIDFWSEVPGHGSIAETARKTVSGPVVGAIRTTDDWVGPDGKRVCADERVSRFYATRSTRVLDFEITLHAPDGPVTFGDTKEGAFGVRVPSSMDVDARKGGKITSSEGFTDANAWGKPATWVDYSGPVEGHTVGIAILNGPESFRAPTTWHVRPYGLFAANPFGWKDFGQKAPGDYTLPQGESISLRYRVILHDGPANPATLASAYRAYASPPVVVVRPE